MSFPGIRRHAIGGEVALARLVLPTDTACVRVISFGLANRLFVDGDDRAPGKQHN